MKRKFEPPVLNVESYTPDTGIAASGQFIRNQTSTCWYEENGETLSYEIWHAGEGLCSCGYEMEACE